MIGVAVEDTLCTACEQRLGQIVRAASTVYLRRLFSPAGNLKPRKPAHVVLALTDTELYLLEFHYRVIGFTVGAALCRWPRRGVVAHWRRRRWDWPTVWQAELSWPELSTYLEAKLMNGEDTDRIMGLLASDELGRELRLAAPSLG